MISKELYENLYNCKGCNIARYEGFLSGNPNIHELAHKCKEWALKNFIVSSGLTVDNAGWFEIYLHTDPDMKIEEGNADTEPEAIFKACEYILDELNNGKS